MSKKITKIMKNVYIAIAIGWYKRLRAREPPPLAEFANTLNERVRVAAVYTDMEVKDDLLR